MRPMLAATATDEILIKHLEDGPLMASYKLDGIRALTTDEGLKSRSLKPIRNEYTQETFKALPPGLDGELIVGSATAKDVFNRTTSGIMSKGGAPDVQYFTFDLWNQDDTPFLRRHFRLSRLLWMNPHPKVVGLGQRWIDGLERLRIVEQLALDEGYEGLIVRRMDAPYKFNRSTANEGYLLKVKRYCDAEAEIVAVNQKFHNANVAVTNELGLTSRSSSKENKVPLDQVGSFRVRDLKEGWEFEVHGFSHMDAAKWWEVRDDLIGKIVTYRYLPIGVVDVPRHPIFKGFRDPDDMA